MFENPPSIFSITSKICFLCRERNCVHCLPYHRRRIGSSYPQLASARPCLSTAGRAKICPSLDQTCSTTTMQSHACLPPTACRAPVVPLHWPLPLIRRHWRGIVAVRVPNPPGPNPSPIWRVHPCTQSPTPPLPKLTAVSPRCHDTHPISAP